MAREFLEVSDMGGNTDEAIVRSSVRPLGNLRFLESFRNAVPLAPPAKKPRVKIDPGPPLEDMPWTMYMPVVSERFRRFLEREAPGHAQYFEAELVGPK